ncbi:IkappaB kinase complex, IKAP component [Piedraia hortae CBS 480.64]|uniref:Elongator complex protein 1 n=1 Tax=Piedraia hortae CBS 480.64 TaxID=1314780 RepID=A0A6A7CAE2_9PEZI|nr:IkappaB kinase complex, IKAP component [Piedraia hortae CBS 480.64]
MRNLIRTRHQETTLEQPISAHAFELDNVASAHCNEGNITLRRISTDGDHVEEITTFPAMTGDCIINIHCFADLGTTIIIFALGDIVAVRNTGDNEVENVEIIGTIDSGIKAASWSPDEELVAIATTADTLLLMTRDFDQLADITLSVEDVKVSNHVSVGWGKKETQFKGRGAAKALRDPTVPEHVDEGSLNEGDDGRVTISWRGDGQCFVLNSILESEPRRRIARIYDRQGTLEAVSEAVNGLEAAMSWMPSGQVIAGVQRGNDNTKVVFFERNGLRHGEFDMRVADAREVDLAWNIDSTVLAVTMSDRVQLWTMGNYHWYLKQEITIDNAQLKWHPEQSLKLALATGHQLQQICYELAFTRGSVKPPHDLGLMAAIDGKKLKVTPLRLANIPPPMSFDEIDLPAPAESAVFNEDGTGITVYHGDKTTAWKWDYTARPVQRAAQCSEQDKLQTEEMFSLSTNGVLKGQGLRIPGCTSFVVTLSHLIYTTSNHLLKFIHLQRLEVPPDEPEKDERCRSIERGAKIVTVIPSAYSLILQMPRGNLETIYPRAFVLAGIRHAINQKDYETAFKICRTHRVDLNILHDYAPVQLKENVGLFISQVQKPEWIDLFLGSLIEENVAMTMYKETLADTVLPQEVFPTGKVNFICDMFLAALPSTSTQNLITAHISKSPPDLESALKLISANGKPYSEAAIEHICFLADVNTLYDTALGLYDLDMALSIAQKSSHKDPREYLPYLQNLHALSEPRRRYSINSDLQRYSKALAELRSMPDTFEEVKSYLQKHSDLYPLAMELYKYTPPELETIVTLYAEHLSSISQFSQAGECYESIREYTRASEAYSSAGLWRESLSCADLAGYDESAVVSLARSLASGLEESKSYASAAVIHRDYLADVSTAVGLLCKANAFNEAFALAAKQRQDGNLFDKVVDPGLGEAAASFTETMAEMSSQLLAQGERVGTLRELKAANPLGFYGDAAEGAGGEFPDDISIAMTDATTTAGTFMTRYTGLSSGSRMTSKNKRREERKRARGKKGTVYEEEYLVNSIKRLVERYNVLLGDAREVVRACLRRGMRERAKAVQTLVKEVGVLAKQVVEKVFVVDEVGRVDGTAKADEVERPTGGRGVLFDALGEMGTKKEKPVVEELEENACIVG